MTPYIILIIAIFIFRGVTLSLPERNGNLWFLALTFIYLYFFCVLRSFDVGRDIQGYISGYVTTASVTWDNWDYISHYEVGYMALMKVCNVIGLTARGFFYVIYAIILFPIYLLIKKYSASPLTSVILFICYQLFAFSLTGLRQAIAMSICMIAFMQAMKPGKKDLIIFIVLVYLASLIHTSSLIFIFAYIIMRIPINKKSIILYILSAIICEVLNSIGVGYVLSVFDNTAYGLEDNNRLGSSLILIIIFIICALYTQYRLKNKNELKLNQYFTNLLMAGLCLMLLFNGSILLRATMYYYFTFILTLAMVPKVLNKDAGIIYTVVLYSVMISYFFTISELFNFDLIPYEIGI